MVFINIKITIAKLWDLQYNVFRKVEFCMETIKLCKHCRIYRKWEYKAGYYYDREIKRPGRCPKCFRKLEDTGMNSGELTTIYYYSKDPDFFDYMMDLKKNNPEKYQSEYDKVDKEGTERLEQKNKQEAEERRLKKIQAQLKAERDKPKCPKCGSTYVALGTRGWSMLTGMIGSNNPMNVCQTCGYKWKPGKS